MQFKKLNWKCFWGGNYLIPGAGVRKGDMGGMEVVEGVGGVDEFPSPDITDMHCEAWRRVEEGRINNY